MALVTHETGSAPRSGRSSLAALLALIAALHSPTHAASDLEAPTGLTAIPGDGQVSLTWNAVADATGYRYRQKGASGGFAPWTDVPGSTGATTGFVVANLANGTTYAFKLRAVRGNRKGPSTPAVEATPSAGAGGGDGGGQPPEDGDGQPPEVDGDLEAPTGLTAVAGDGQVSLTWNAVADATGYRYRQKGASGGFGPWTDVPGSTGATTGFVVANLANGTTYAFKLRAVRGNRKGPSTPAVEVTPGAAAGASDGSGQPPEVVAQLPALSLVVGGVAEIDLADRFQDRDGEPLSYAARSSEAAVATVSIVGDATLRVVALVAGRSDAVASAADPDEAMAESAFAVVVAEPAFEENVVLEAAGESFSIDLSQMFPGMDPQATVAPESSNPDVLEARISEQELLLVPGENEGVVEIVATATYGSGWQVVHRLQATVDVASTARWFRGWRSTLAHDDASGSGELD